MTNLWHNKIADKEYCIDFVIPWVDGSDPSWLNERKKYMSCDNNLNNDEVRYRDWDNLKYWFRGVEENAPWVRKIHFITWGHTPAWLYTLHPKISIVNHKDYIPEKYLPTFNSHVIELNLHRISGLSEHFVYFNDDIFITNRISPTDFFHNDLPCDNFALNCIFFGTDSVGHIHGSDVEVINRNFSKKNVLKKNWRKWLHPSNGLKSIIRTGLLMSWPWFPGFYYQHLTNSYVKSTFNIVWGLEEKCLDETCHSRFREKTNVNQWLFKFWQLASGMFYPSSVKFGRCFHLKDSNFFNVCSCIKNSKYKLICINDVSKTNDFENKKIVIKKTFKERFPYKSTFEI